PDWHKISLRLYDEKGAIGPARIGDYFLLSRAVMPGESAKDVWGVGGVMLVGKLKGEAKTIARARWARSASLPEPVLAIAQVPSPSLRKAAVAAFRELHASKELQAAWRAWLKENPSEDQKTANNPWYGADKNLLVTVFSPLGTKPLIIVSAQVAGLCNEF